MDPRPRLFNLLDINNQLTAVVYKPVPRVYFDLFFNPLIWTGKFNMASRFVTTKEKERSHPAAPNSHNHAQDRASSKQTPRPLNNAVPNKVAFNPEQGGNIYEIEKLPVPLADHNRLFSKPELNPAAGQSTHRDVLSRSNPKLVSVKIELRMRRS